MFLYHFESVHEHGLPASAHHASIKQLQLSGDSFFFFYAGFYSFISHSISPVDLCKDRQLSSGIYCTDSFLFIP